MSNKEALARFYDGAGDKDSKVCPIWGTPAEVGRLWCNSNPPHEVHTPVHVSHRTWGEYVILGKAIDQFNHYQEPERARVKARLTTWLIDQRLMGVTWPKITRDCVEDAAKRTPLTVHDRADRLLKYLERESPVIGRSVPGNISNPADPKTMEMLAWSESLSVDEIDFLARYLSKQGWITNWPFIITVDGYARLAELATKHVNSSQGFVAMWFDEEMQEAYENGIKPGIENAGYTPLRVDQKEHINKIDDEIIAEIRRSRFLVADFTHGDDGARGGVYYEAGFAYGLNIPVIFTCRADKVDGLHFDTRQYNHILWRTPEDLRQQLALRISAVIGDGPGKTHELKGVQ